MEKLNGESKMCIMKHICYVKGYHVRRSGGPTL